MQSAIYACMKVVIHTILLKIISKQVLESLGDWGCPKIRGIPLPLLNYSMSFDLFVESLLHSFCNETIRVVVTPRNGSVV